MFNPMKIKKGVTFLLLILFLPLLLLSCTQKVPANIVPTKMHMTYNYAHVAFPINTIFQSEQQLYTLTSKDHLELVWKPHPDHPSTDSQPLIVTINGTLIGPFSSSGTLEKAVQNSDFTQKPTIASFATMQTTNWTNKTYTSVMKLPSSIISGYYILLQIITLTGKAQHAVGKAAMEIQVK